ncbi:unnamed protein product [Rhizophagus irregularis]|nr:unnamed protein product [Rhizophagus irregularis]
MSAVRKDSINAIINKAYTLMDNKIHDDIHKKFEFQQKVILDDEMLTENQKTRAINQLNKYYDRNKVLFNEGKRRICENCNQVCLATLFCEYCVRNNLKVNFSNWTSNNDEIDNLIRKCQMETLGPDYIIEWIPYDNLQNIKYLTEGGISKIYRADWIGGNYDEWDMEKNQLKRFGTFEVILKSLENVESASHSWFEEAKSHLTINNKRPEIVRCYGLTRDISNGNYMLVMMKMDMDLREYLQRNHHQLTWKKRIRIIFEILDALYYLHIENAIHRDLHSGNILYSQFEDYCIAMLMWEVSFGQPPFINCEHNFDLIVNIIGGLRPNFASEIPLEYKNLIEICWNADPLKRLDIYTLRNKIIEISKLYQNMLDESFQSNLSNLNMNKYSLKSAGSRLLAYQFNSPLPNTKNVSEMLTVEYSYSKLYELVIPNNYIEENHL